MKSIENKIKLKREKRSELSDASPEEGIGTNEQDATSVLDNIWSTPYDEGTHQLAQLELRLYKQKRKVYEIQRVIQQHVETTIVLLSMLHAGIEEI